MEQPPLAEISALQETVLYAIVRAKPHSELITHEEPCKKLLKKVIDT